MLHSLAHVCQRTNTNRRNQLAGEVAYSSMEMMNKSVLWNMKKSMIVTTAASLQHFFKYEN